MTIRADRLLKLADYLETVPRKKFDMRFWKDEGACGFAGCAIGWAAHGKLFRGLTIKGTSDLDFEPHYAGATRMAAVSLLFGISIVQAQNDLFGGWDELQGTPLQVSKRIRKFVREHKDTSHAD